MDTDKPTNTLLYLIILIAVLALFAAGLGIFWQGEEGQSYEFRTLRGETVMIQGHGLYHYDTISVAAQAIAQDGVTLLVGIPLLILAMVFFRRGILQGKVLLAGTLAYFLYTYTSFSFGMAYNVMFLVYVTLFTLSLFAFILTLMAIDIPTLPERFSSHLPRRTIAIFLFILGGFLLLDWLLDRIGPALLANQPPYGLESYTTLVIQVLDLGVIVPISLLAGILLWKQRPWGYLLSSIMLVTGVTFFLAILGMIINEILAGVQVSSAEIVMFPIIALINLGLVIALLKSISKPVSILVKG
jgi:hypothetical protein